MSKPAVKGLSLLLLLSSLAWSQGAFVPPQQALKVVNGITAPAPLATITVCAGGAAGIPCIPALVGAIFKDIALTQPLPNPFTADANGNYQFAIAPGTYTVTVTASGFAGNSYQITVQPATNSTPGGTNAQLQVNNSGLFGGLANAASGSVLASQGVSTLPIFQKKVQHDVRDAGIDCTGTVDSTAVFQGLINAVPDYSVIVLPENCVIKVSGTPAITINQRNGLQFIGQGRSANFCGTTQSQFFYNQAYASGNTVFNINQSQQMLFQNITVLSNGNADIVWNVDQTTSPPITTDIVWTDVCIRNNAAKNAAFRGWRFSNISSSNVEAMHLIRPWVQCSSNGPGSATDSGVGIIFSASANQKNEVIDDAKFGGCSVGVSFGGGAGGGSDLTMSSGLDSTSWINLQMGGFNDALMGFRSENAHTGVVQETNSVGPHLIMHNDFAAIVTPPIDCPSGCGNTTLINNTTDTSFGNWFNAHGLRQGVLFAAANHNLKYDPYDWLASVVMPGDSVNLHGAGLGGMVLSAGLAVTPNNSDCGAGSCGSPPIFLDGQISSGSVTDQFVIQAAPNETTGPVTTNNTLMFVHNQPSAVTPWIAMQGQQTGAVYAQSPTPINVSVTTRGTAGGATYTYLVVGHGATGTTPASATTSIATGNATLSSTNFNFIQAPPCPGCTFFDVYRTACGGVGICNTNPTGKIGVMIAASVTNSLISANTSPEPYFSDTGLAGDGTTAPVINTTGQVQSTVPTGLAPLSIASTTPVANLSLGGGTGTSVNSATYATNTNCASAGGTCGSAASGSVSIAAGAATVTVVTSAVTANSVILITEDMSLGTKLSVTCNTNFSNFAVTVRLSGQFTIAAPANAVTNPYCLNYFVIN